MQDTQKPNPAISSRDYITSLMRRPTLYCYHQARLSSPQPLPWGGRNCSLQHLCTNTSLLSRRGFHWAAGSVQPHAGSCETEPFKHEQLLFLVWQGVSAGQDSCLQGAHRLCQRFCCSLLTSPLRLNIHEIYYMEIQSRRQLLSLFTFVHCQ